MNMQQLYSTKEREIILDYLLENPDEKINMNALARKLKVSPAQVYNYLKILEKYRLFKGKLIDNSISRSLRMLKNLNEIKKSGVIEQIKKKIKNVKGIGVYGSWANGTNHSRSDLDLWIKTEKDLSDLELAQLNKGLSKTIKAPVEVIVLTPERMTHLKEKTESLYYSLFNSILLWGDAL